MKDLHITPSLSTYSILMSSLAKARRIEHCEHILKEVQEVGMTPDKATYTSLLVAYAKQNNPVGAEKVLR